MCVIGLFIKRKTQIKLEQYNFVEVYENILQLFTKRLKCEHTAKDILQDASITAFLNIDKFDGRNFKNWFYTICNNTYKNSLRKTRELSSNLDEFEVNACSVNIEQQFIKKTLVSHIKNIMDSKYYLPLLLYAQGYKYKEIAHKLGLTQSCVTDRIRVARKICNKKINKA